MAAIFFAAILSILMSSLQDGVFDNLIKNMVSFYSGYIQVHKSGYWNEQTLENSFSVTNAVKQNLSAQPYVNKITPRLESFALAASTRLTKGCLVVGIDPDNEREVIQLQNKIATGSYLTKDDDGIIVGEGLMKKLKLQLHDTIVLIGQGYHGATAAGKYRVKGILKFGSPQLNDKMLFMTLATAQQLYGAEGQITSYIISISATDKVDGIANSMRKTLGSNYEVMTWKDIMPDVVQHMTTEKASMLIMQTILYLLICFGIFGTLLMLMVERRYEMGMLLAIGMNKSKLILLIVVESLLGVFVACVLGVVCSIPIVYYLNRHPIRFSGKLAEMYQRFGFEAIFPTSTERVHFINQGIIVLFFGVILSIYPIITILRLNAVKALKK